MFFKIQNIIGLQIINIYEEKIPISRRLKPLNKLTQLIEICLLLAEKELISSCLFLLLLEAGVHDELLQLLVVLHMDPYEVVVRLGQILVERRVVLLLLQRQLNFHLQLVDLIGFRVEKRLLIVKLHERGSYEPQLQAVDFAVGFGLDFVRVRDLQALLVQNHEVALIDFVAVQKVAEQVLDLLLLLQTLLQIDRRNVVEEGLVENVGDEAHAFLLDVVFFHQIQVLFKQGLEPFVFLL